MALIDRQERDPLRRCISCGEWKARSEFEVRSKRRVSQSKERSSRCRECLQKFRDALALRSSLK